MLVLGQRPSHCGMAQVAGFRCLDSIMAGLAGGRVRLRCPAFWSMHSAAPRCPPTTESIPSPARHERQVALAKRMELSSGDAVAGSLRNSSTAV